MTERLYYHDATLRRFAAKVLELADGGRRAYLDRTAFYPTSGGQPHDTGTVSGARVVDVVDEGDRIAHVLETPLSSGVAAIIEGEIDWPHRYDLMQQHTGQHLLSAVIEDALALRTLSVHFGAESSTLDVAGASGSVPASLEAATMARLEAQANAIVSEARPVRVTFEEATAAQDLRKASEREGTLRVITIEGLDRSACGGTHVATTAQIGPVLLRRQERVKQGLRIEFICGDRALRRARRDLELLTDVARTFSGSLDEVAKLVEGQAAQLGTLQAEHRRLNETLAKYRAAELYAGAAPRADGLRIVVERLSSGADSARSLALAFGPLTQVLFIAASHNPPSILVATSADSGLDAGKLLRPHLENVGGRGGGSARLAQGSVSSPEAIDRLLQLLTSAPASVPG